MTGRRDSWYLDRLGAELVRVAAQQDAAEQRRVRLPLPSWRRLALPLAAVAAVALVIALGAALLVAGDEERAAQPAPAPAPTVVPDDPIGAALERFDGVYVAEVSEATLRQFGMTDPPAGVWKLAISADARTLEISTAEDAPGSGGYTLPVIAAAGDRITFGPDRGCEVREQRERPARVRLALTASILTFQRARGGCTREWALLSSLPWRKA